MRWVSVLQSVLAALFGVQSESKRVKDFQSSSALPYIVIGFLFVTAFVVGLALLVNAILPK
ncbi:hypothetical protein PALB_16780 [Pseudoalteromonas luteoviolacea B = ATCC 29581]|nr:hypothetical protein PALB_16780 [Pseudoalteromonas luteoviolacea B = ATCC 29581]